MNSPQQIIFVPYLAVEGILNYNCFIIFSRDTEGDLPFSQKKYLNNGMLMNSCKRGQKAFNPGGLLGIAFLILLYPLLASSDSDIKGGSCYQEYDTR